MSLENLLNIGVRWLDIAFVGHNVADPTQAYAAHNSDSAFGIAYGASASSVFSTIGTFLAKNLSEIVVLWLKPGERDAAIKSPSGPGGYIAFFNLLKSSSAGPYLMGEANAKSADGEWVRVGDAIKANRRLIVMGWDVIPPDVGITSNWVQDSWSDPHALGDLTKEGASAYCTASTSVLAIISDYVNAQDPMFDLVKQHIKMKAGAVLK
ncbi:hypothetical protein HDU76_010531 [Blyttiomyces sp. JEL0837]|nr:hypothetical protein HDU76_010531 [Blyttiomyces sp. JEL0837]